MIYSLQKYLIPIITGTVVLSLNGCTPFLNNAPDNNEVSNNNNNPVIIETNEDVTTITFGVYTADKPTTVVKQFRPTLNALQDRMSENMGETIKIKMEVASSYEEGIQDLVDGEVDFSRLGPASYVEAKKLNPKLSILAIESKGGEKIFYGIIAVNKDSDIQNVTQLKGRSFAFGDQLSTIGRYLSQQYLYENGIKASDLSRYEYLDRHDKVGTAVGLKQFDAGALKEGTFNKLVKKGTAIRSIAKFPNVEKPWVGSGELSEDLYQQLSKALLEISNTEALESLGIGGFLTGTDDDYKAIEKAIDNNQQFFE